MGSATAVFRSNRAFNGGAVAATFGSSMTIDRVTVMGVRGTQLSAHDSHNNPPQFVDNQAKNHAGCLYVDRSVVYNTNVLHCPPQQAAHRTTHKPTPSPSSELVHQQYRNSGWRCAAGVWQRAKGQPTHGPQWPQRLCSRDQLSYRGVPPSPTPVILGPR